MRSVRYLAALLLVVASCRKHDRAPPDPTPPPVLPPPPPTLGGAWLAELDHTGHVAVPVGAQEKRPVIVAVHGAASRSDWMCRDVRAGFGPYPFVVCPHPSDALEREASWGSPEALTRAITRSLAAARARFSDWIDEADPIYVGHSQGAMLAARGPIGAGAYRHLVFFEGLPADVVAARAAILRSNAESLLLVSGQSGWQAGHGHFAASFAGTRVRARHVHEPVGHFFHARIYTRLRSEVSWLVADDPRYRPMIE